MLRTIIAIFVILHGLVHAILAMVPNPRAATPVLGTFFSGFGSWLFTGLSETNGQKIATTLAIIATIGFVASSLAFLDVLVPFDWWRALAIAAAVVSLSLLIMFWDMYLIVGALIDVAVLLTLCFTK